MPPKSTPGFRAREKPGIRIERKAKAQLVSEDGQGWAVSYSDMLMVLMSFFVLFFSRDGDHKATLVSQIALELQDQGGDLARVKERSATPSKAPAKRLGSGEGSAGYGAGGSGTGTHTPQAEPKPSLDTKSLAESFALFAVTVQQLPDENALIVDFPDEMYRARRFDLDPANLQTLRAVLTLLLPHKEVVALTIVGHTDDAPLSRPSAYLGSNIDLSSLRASHAMAIAEQMGFDPHALAIQSVGASRRNSRSLSLEVRERK